MKTMMTKIFILIMIFLKVDTSQNNEQALSNGNFHFNDILKPPLSSSSSPPSSPPSSSSSPPSSSAFFFHSFPARLQTRVSNINYKSFKSAYQSALYPVKKEGKAKGRSNKDGKEKEKKEKKEEEKKTSENVDLHRDERWLNERKDNYEKKIMRLQGHEVCVQGHEVGVQGHEVGVQGHEVGVQGHEVSVQEHEVSVQGHEVGVQGHEVAVQGHFVGVQGRSRNDEVSHFLGA